MKQLILPRGRTGNRNILYFPGIFHNKIMESKLKACYQVPVAAATEYHFIRLRSFRCPPRNRRPERSPEELQPKEDDL
jgi:hypothetical protein